MNFGLSNTIIEQICSVFSKHPGVEKVIIYGSRAKGNYKNGSDIDIALIGGEDLTVDVMFIIIEEIDDLFLPYTFDISLLRYINDPDVLDHIKRVGKVFYKKK
jgi:predicted nucleotidyltransferase